MAEPRYLVDSAVLLRGHQAVVWQRLEALGLDGRLRTCRMVDLEYVYSTHRSLVPGAIEGRQALPEVPITPRTMDHALEIMGELSAAGLHRGAKPADCVIAACAIEAGIPVLHYDHDFDRLAEVTGLRAEWVAEPGSLDGG